MNTRERPICAVMLILFGFWCSVLQKAEAKLILVGGAQGWHYGFNYTDWVSKVAPIRINDTLVFKYAAPGPNSLPHSVYLLRNKKRYRACSLQGGKLLAGPTEGAGKKGFLYKLTKPKRYFFACGAGNGIHCEDGLMKFSVRPC